MQGGGEELTFTDQTNMQAGVQVRPVFTTSGRLC